MNTKGSTDRSSESVKSHRRQTLWQIILPFFIVCMVFVSIMVVAGFIEKRASLALISDLFLTICILCPLLICLFPFVILMIAAVTGMHKAHGTASGPLHRLELMTESVLNKTIEITDKINHRTISMSSRLAPLTKLLSLFDRPKSEQLREEKDEPKST